MSFELASGAVARWTNEVGGRAVVCVNGGTSAEVPGTWSASVEWLVRRLAVRFPSIGFLEVRYRVKSWRQFDRCVEDGAAAIAAATAAGAEELALLGFSMGGAVAARNAAAGSVRRVVGVNPWLPAQVDLEPLRGRRLFIVHASLDAPLPGIPGVKPSLSLLAAERARSLGVEVERHVTPGFHALAVRRRRGALVPLPGSRRIAALVAGELDAFCA